MTVVDSHPLLQDKETEVVFKVYAYDDIKNFYGMIHGGGVCTIFDVCTSIAELGISNELRTSVTVKIDIDFMKAVKIHTNIFVKTKIVKAGRRLVFLSAEIFDEKGKICYTCTHSLMKVKLSELGKNQKL